MIELFFCKKYEWNTVKISMLTKKFWKNGFGGIILRANDNFLFKMLVLRDVIWRQGQERHPLLLDKNYLGADN